MGQTRKLKTSEKVSRRDFMASVAASPLLPGVGASQGNIPAINSNRRAAWIEDWPLVIVGNWDDAPLFICRRGNIWTWQDEEYRSQQTEDTVKKLKELGVTLAVLCFYKGFGLVAERPYFNDARKMAALCHRFGIKVGVYVGSTISYEAFLLENPKAEDWIVSDYQGRPVTYSRQQWRKRVYFMHPGYREYMKRVLRVAVEEVQTDLIHFDNTSNQAEPAIFQHPLAAKDFRAFLASKYTPDALEKRLGIRDPRYVLPPCPDWELATIDDPLFQEWTDFRCEMLSRYYQEMAAFIHSLNPQVAVVNNPARGLSGSNTYWQEGVDYPRLLAHTQAVWAEEGKLPHPMAGDILVSKIRTYQMAAKLNNRIFTSSTGLYGGRPQSETQVKLDLAEAMAYNRQCLGMVGGIQTVQRLTEGAKKYIQFFGRNARLFRRTESAADVAVFHSFGTLAFNNDRPYQSTWLFEQTLIQAKIPFDIIFDQHLKDLSQYRVLILADVECLSEEQLNVIRAYVKKGGGLVATEWTSLYTEWRALKSNFGLGDLFQVEPPAFIDNGITVSLPVHQSKSDTGPVRNQTDGGRVVYLPEVKPSVAKPAMTPMANHYWALPLNAPELVDAVRWAGGGELALEVKAPPAVTTNLVSQRSSGAVLVHLVNYDVERTPKVENIEVWLRPPVHKKVMQVSLFSPDDDGVQTLPPITRDGKLGFVVPSLNTYSVVEIQWE